MSFELKDAPQEILEGIQRDRERSREATEKIAVKLEELDARMEAVGRPSREESLRALLARRFVIGETRCPTRMEG